MRTPVDTIDALAEYLDRLGEPETFEGELIDRLLAARAIVRDAIGVDAPWADPRQVTFRRYLAHIDFAITELFRPAWDDEGNAIEAHEEWAQWFAHAIGNWDNVKQLREQFQADKPILH